MSKTFFTRFKASVVSLSLAATSVSAASMALSANAIFVPPPIPGHVTNASTTMKVDSSVKGTFPSTGATSITFTIESDYETSFSYGLGVSIADSPYWTEHNSKGGWDSKGDGYSVKLTKGTNEVTVDLSDVDIKSGGSYEFRCYYCAHWDNSKSDMVDNSVRLTDTSFDSSSSGPSGTIEKNRKQSGEWSFKDNKDGTATISATVSRQIDDLDILLTAGYDEDYYASHPSKFTEDAPINSHKFSYADFGLSSDDDITFESLTVVVESDTAFDKFMYGGGLNVESGSPADTEYAKREAGIKGKETAGYWYNDMGEDAIEEFESDGVEFGIDDIGTGTTLEGAGKYIVAYWEPPASVREYQSSRPSDTVSFQYWYGTADTTKYTELDTCRITSATMTYTIEKTVPYTKTTSSKINETLKHASKTANKIEIPYSDLGIDESMDVYAIKFDVTASSEIGKLVYGVGTGTTEAPDYWYQDEANFVVLDAGKTAEIMWILPNAVAGKDAESNIVNPDGNVYFGYYYGEASSITMSNIEVYYDKPVTTTTTTTTTTTITTTTTTTTPKKGVWGDSNMNGTVAMNDAVLIMQAVSNSDAFGIDGTDPNALTNDGAYWGDVYDHNNGDITSMDALQIQKYLIHIVRSLDPKA